MDLVRTLYFLKYFMSIDIFVMLILIVPCKSILDIYRCCKVVLSYLTFQSRIMLLCQKVSDIMVDIIGVGLAGKM